MGRQLEDRKHPTQSTEARSADLSAESRCPGSKVRRCKYRVYDKRLQVVHNLLEKMVKDTGLTTRCCNADFGRHVFRELNEEA
eukprot:5994346-Karenia_brevis.AAC.1